VSNKRQVTVLSQGQVTVPRGGHSREPWGGHSDELKDDTLVNLGEVTLVY